MVSAAIRASMIAPLSIHPEGSRRLGGDGTGPSCPDRRSVAGSGGTESDVGSDSSSTPRATDDKGSDGDENCDRSGIARPLSPRETGVRFRCFTHLVRVGCSHLRQPWKPNGRKQWRVMVDRAELR